MGLKHILLFVFLISLPIVLSSDIRIVGNSLLTSSSGTASAPYNYSTATYGMYGIWWYNMTTGGDAYNYSDATYSMYGKWFYNMSDGVGGSDYNYSTATYSMYGIWFYNMSDGTGGAEYNYSTATYSMYDIKWSNTDNSSKVNLNQTYYDLFGCINNYSYLSTYNATYDKFAYNMTEPDDYNYSTATYSMYDTKWSNTDNSSKVVQNETYYGYAKNISNHTKTILEGNNLFTGKNNFTNNDLSYNSFYVDYGTINSLKSNYTEIKSGGELHVYGYSFWGDDLLPIGDVVINLGNKDNKFNNIFGGIFNGSVGVGQFNKLYVGGNGAKFDGSIEAKAINSNNITFNAGSGLSIASNTPAFFPTVDRDAGLWFMQGPARYSFFDLGHKETANLTIDGELRLSGLTGVNTVLCLKSDGAIGNCQAGSINTNGCTCI